MESLTQLGRQLLAIWKKLGLNQRLSIVLAAAVVLGGLAALTWWSSRENYALLYGRLDEAEAAKIVTVLTEGKIPYRLGQGRGAIYVPASRVHATRLQLAAKGIPKGDGVGFEIFDKPNFGISDFVQRANYLRAIQGELARTISQLDEVEGARVMIVMPENRLLLDSQKRTTASVFVRVRGNTPLAPETVNSIRSLVANAVEGLQFTAVSVVDNRGNVLTDTTEPDSAAGLSSSQLAVRRTIEQYLAHKVEGMLEKVLGPGQAVVRVAAEINTETVNRTEEKFDPDGQVIRTSTANEETSEMSNGAPPGGVPGISANTTSNATAAAANNNTHSRKKLTTNQYEINKTTSSILQGPGGLKRVSAAVFVAAQTEGTGAARKVVARTPEELEKLRRLVQTALGLQLAADAGRQDEIALEEMPFNDSFAVDTTEQLVTEQRQERYWDLGKNAGYLLAALVVVALFWRGLRQAPLETIPLGVPVGPLASATGAATGAPAGDPSRANIDSLNELLRQQPQQVTRAVRVWLNQTKN